MKTIPNPKGEKRARFAKEQESCRKDVERAFGVLQSRWPIVRHLARCWSIETLGDVMNACVIMHNMIVEDERPERLNDGPWQYQGDNVVPNGPPAAYKDFLQFHRDMRDRGTHVELQNDLVEHM